MAEARKKQRLFVDIDGTLAVFTPVDTLETLYEQGYFLNLAPHENVVAAVKEIVANHPEIEVNILSAYLTDSQYALQEKNEWLDRYLPEIDQAHRVFVPCGSDKKEGISGGIRSDDFLLDDYTHNLNEWQPPARGIKLLNAINHTRGSWEHDRIRYDRTPTDLADGILSIMRDEKQIFDEKINESGVSQVRNALESRVTGDELLNAQDLIEELRAVGADIDENGYVTVYHRTDHASEENIKSSHVMVAKEDGLFFSTVENGQNEGYGDSIVKLSIPVEKLVLDDIFSDEAHLRYPLENGIRQLDISDYLLEEREENMAQERQPSLNHISEIAIDRHEAEYGADGSRNFPNLNDPSPEEQAEELRQIVAEKSAPVEIDETLPPKDQLKQRLENGVRQVLDSEQFKNWLTTGGKLFYNNYSFRNAMLVWLQKPDASYVMGYEKWKDFGRNVKQGAQGAKIFIPLMASEKYKGGLFRSIKSNLTDQLSKDPSLTEASYRLGTSNLEFTMNRANHLIGFKVNGKEQQIFGSDDEAKRFIDRAIIGKVPTGFTVGTVFDAKDVIVPEYLWVKSGYTKEEIAPDEKGNPVKNRRGEVRIFNTPERQARFQTELDTRIVAKDPVKMQALFDACVAASERKGVPVSLAEKADDSTLDGGAKGYFSRQFTEDKPNGFIVIDNSLEITEKCAVLFHEMGHADLHKNLEALAKSMGEDKITREMREVQAEATAYAVASTFGIETDTSSFQYLAAYARGFELQDFQKSLDVIYRETQALTNDIKAELDIRGLNLDLTEKPKEMLNKETLETLSTKYMDFAAEQGSKVQAALNELPSLVKQSAGNPELMDVLKYQKANLDSRKADLDTMLTAIENLNTADTREKQDEIISTLDAAMNRVNGDAYAFENLSENYVVITERARGGLKVDFEQNPQKTLEAMKKDYPALAKLSEPQLQYLATSKFVAREFTKLLRDNPQEFVDKACERAALISKAASKNGTFVEVNFCEQWTDKPFFEKGTLCSPKIADKTVTGCEAQARGFSAEAEKRGDYFPYTKCDLTIFTPNKDGKLISLNTRVDIGDGAQTSLKDHLEQLCKRGSERKEVLANFTEALTERADKRKLLVQDLSAKPQSAEQPEMTTEKEGNMSREEWDGQIKDAREKAAQEQREKAAEKAQNKSNRDRAE